MSFTTFLIVVAVILVIIIIKICLGLKRLKDLRCWAAGQDFSFSEAHDSQFDQRHPFKCLKEGSNRYAYNIMTGSVNGRDIQAFDYHYEEKSTDPDGERGTSNCNFSAIIFKADFSLKPLVIRPEHIFDKMSSLFGKEDIKFESEAFDKAFHVSAQNETWAYDILHDQAIEWLMGHPRHHIEFSKSHVLITRDGRKFKPSEFELAMRIADGLLDLVPKYVKQQQSC